MQQELCLYASLCIEGTVLPFQGNRFNGEGLSIPGRTKHSRPNSIPALTSPPNNAKGSVI
eukprot:c29107_g1_i1 orf=661-840(+)